MSTLKHHILNRIAHDGPLSIADYMQECLLHPEYGYYARQDPFGQQGDFVTAPEISQMFGEMIGLGLAQSWIDQGKPSSFCLVEMGPGRGTLMADILRATAAIPGFHQAALICLVEASSTLTAIQKTNVPTAKHFATVGHLPGDKPVFFVANEFFDALPIRQFIRQKDQWAERRIGANDADLVWGLTPAQDVPALSPRLRDTKEGDLVELNIHSQAVMIELATRISENGGAGLIIDYGDWGSLGDTFQAIHNHKAVDPLTEPGQADLTAHVDFETLAQGCGLVSHSKLTTQGVFLERLGITERAKMLAKGLNDDALSNHIAAHRRLTHPDEMGSLFKVLGLTAKTAAPIAGLEF